MATPAVAKGYRVVPQRIWPTAVPGLSGSGGGDGGSGDNLNDGDVAYRFLHLKEHRGLFRATAEGDAKVGKEFSKGTTLFVGNVDDQGGRLCRQAIQNRLRRAFAKCGTVKHVQVSPAPDGTSDTKSKGSSQGHGGKSNILGSRFAHICFSTSEGVQAALALPEIPSGYRAGAVAGDHDKKKSKKMKASRKRNRSDTEGPFSLDEPLEKESGRDENGDEILGFAGFIQRHRRKFPPRAKLQAEADSIMERFEGEEAAEAAARKALLEQPPDDDGFVMVTYKKKKRGRNNDGPDAAAAHASSGNKRKKKNGAGPLPDFYRFQMRETRREQLANLRTKFEQDKARVAKMKEQRKFRPF